MGHILDTLNNNAEKPVVGATLMAAGFIPPYLDPTRLQAVYYLLLIIPAAYHVYAWFMVNVAPNLCRLHRKIKNLWTR